MSVRELNIARGLMKADLVLKNANIVNVFTEEIQNADIALCGNTIVGIGSYEGNKEIDCTNKYVTPGFIDGHIHLESSMLKPIEFAKSVIPHGTTGVITDPHEIANVCGTSGIEYMLQATNNLPLDTYFMIPSCVPATPFDQGGSVLLANDIEYLYDNERVLGLAEVMDYIGTIQGSTDILDKIGDAKKYGKVIDGHAPNLYDKDLCAYVAANILSDHECSNINEAKEKLSLGQWIMIREGTAAKNMEALIDLFQPPFHHRAMLVTDDKHPHDILEYGHIDYMIRKAISLGVNPCIAIKMASFNTATYFGIKNVGAIAPSYRADLLILSDLNQVTVETVIKNGEIIFNEGILNAIEEPEISKELTTKVFHSFQCSELTKDDLIIPIGDKNSLPTHMKVIELIKNEILTKKKIVPLKDGNPRISTEDDILKLAVIERHHNTGNIGLGFVHGFGLKEGAIASSVSHDSHNLIVIGCNDNDMVVAANRIREMEGGLVVVKDSKVLGQISLPIGGLMSELDAKTLSDELDSMKILSRQLGVIEGIDPFMTLAFISLPVIPSLRLTTNGLVDTNEHKIVSLTY